MTAARNLIDSEEAHWTGSARYWAHVQQFPPRRAAWVRGARKHSSWWLVALAVVMVGLALHYA